MKVSGFTLCCVVLLSALFIACGGQKENQEQPPANPSFTSTTPQPVTYETVAHILQDMSTYAAAVKKLDNAALQKLDKSYQGVIFTTEQKTLFVNVYPDQAGGRVIFLLVPKEPSTGSNYLLTFDRKLPVIDSETVELQVRTRDPEKPLTCSLQVADTAAYMTEYPSHQLVARYYFTKKFLQSGTYDFDALTVPSYRPRGYHFIVFDFVKAEVVDQTSSLTAPCVD
ncbi:hypothetical protein L0156_29295 [bacterium]|nr:hypothetical protein [bacterium]